MTVDRAPSDLDINLQLDAEPTLTLKNCVKNDGGVQKQSAVETYELEFSMAVDHEKMT